MATRLWSSGLCALVIAVLAFSGCENGGSGQPNNGCPEWCNWQEQCDPYPNMETCVSDCNNYLDVMAAQCAPGCDEAESDIYFCRGALTCGADVFTECAAEYDHYSNLCCEGGVCCDERI